mgnify:CR=1 FL=1
MTQMMKCWNRPAIGELNGFEEAKKLENGNTPSRPSCWMILPWEKITERTLPRALSPTNAAAALFA